MKKNQLGNSDLHLSEIGFGAWAIGGGNWMFGWGDQDDKESIKAIHKAIDSGINWIDTAAIYGLGHSERIVAEAIEGIRKELIIATKCSLVWNDEGQIESSLEAESILQECDSSLRRLKTDFIDLYQIHWPNDEERIEEGWRAVTTLIEQGKVRYGGVSNFNASQMSRAQEISQIASSQPPYSIMRRGVETNGDFDFCKQNNIGVVAYSPMQSGLLTGGFDIKKIAPNDWRRDAEEYQEPNLSINLEFVEKLRKTATDYDKSVAQLAVAWTLRLEVVTSAIVGARSPAQISETAGGAGWHISEESLGEIDELLAWRLNEVREKGGYINPN